MLTRSFEKLPTITVLTVCLGLMGSALNLPAILIDKPTVLPNDKGLELRTWTLSIWSWSCDSLILFLEFAIRLTCFIPICFLLLDLEKTGITTLLGTFAW